MADAHPGNCMTVATLIDKLKELPGDMPVTGYRGDEATGFVSEESAVVKHSDGRYSDLLNADGTRYIGPHFDIMGD